MRFRTEIEIAPLKHKIGYGSRILTVGSCFADNMAAALSRGKFRITANPAGVMFNPASIAQVMNLFGNPVPVAASEMQNGGNRYFDYRFHGSLSDTTAQGAAEKVNKAIACGHEALAGASDVIITFGTSWVYELKQTGEIVANCHKQPAALFNRRRLGTNEIIETCSALLEGLLKEKHVIFTLSPVRHLADGFEQNSLSKAVLRVAIDEIVSRYDNAEYFPAYEIVNDDLRDYRFYADDLVHPSSQAIAYIREKFIAAAIEPAAAAFLPRAERIAAAAQHRPADTRSAEYALFCRKMLAEIDDAQAAEPSADFSAERSHFAAYVQPGI